MLQFLFYGMIWILFIYGTSFINVCIHELGHGIAGKILGLNFRIEIGQGKKLFQITDHFIVLRELSSGRLGYTHFYIKDDYEKYSKLSYKAKVFFMSGGILAQIIQMMVIVILYCNGIGTNYFLLDLLYKFMLLSSIILLLSCLVPSSKYKSDGFVIYNLIKNQRTNPEENNTNIE